MDRSYSVNLIDGNHRWRTWSGTDQSQNYSHQENNQVAAEEYPASRKQVGLTRSIYLFTTKSFIIFKNG
jgi:hypothetical protein